MPGDYSRNSDRLAERRSALFIQQGRVQVDADWNELVTILLRRLRNEANDVFGAAAVPRATTPDAFSIATTTTNGAPDLTLGVGRIYVDGVAAECFASDAATYLSQPFLSNPPPLPASGNAVVYLDVWEREVTAIEDPQILDSALNGVDTSTRLQTVWQVKVSPQGGPAAECMAESALTAAFPASGGLLTTQVVPAVQAPDPCSLPSSGGYQGVDNRLYRVEVHDATQNLFKWSRDNGSVATRVSALSNGATTVLTVASVGRDDDLGFHVGDWLELTDDVYELAAQGRVPTPGPAGENTQPGAMASVTFINAAARTITLDRNLASWGFDPLGGRGLRARRWDQTQNLYVPTSGVSSGLVAAFAPAPGWVTLENGIQVRFDLAPGGTLQVGDAWIFAARAANSGSIEVLTEAPPIAIRHHYCSLATLTGLGAATPATIADCRSLWPSLGAGSGCCMAAIGPGDLVGTTLQAIVDQYKNTSTVLCFEAGTYSLSAPVRLSAAHSGMTFKGCEGGVIFKVTAGSESAFQDGMIVLDGASSVTVSGIAFALPAVPFVAPQSNFAGLPLSTLGVESTLQTLYVSIGVRAVSSVGLVVKNCYFDFGIFAGFTGKAFAAGTLQSGPADGLVLEANRFAGAGFAAGYVLTPTVSLNPPPSLVFGHFPGDIDRLRIKSGAIARSPQSQATQERFAEAQVAGGGLAGGAVTGGLAGGAVAGGGLAGGAVAGGGLAGGGLGGGGLGGGGLFPGGLVNLPVWWPTPVTQDILQTSAGLKKITSFLSPQVNLAANGGTVLVPTLASATIKDNEFGSMGVAVLVIAETGAVKITGNDADNGAVGVCIVAPEEATILAYEPTCLFVAFAAMGYPLPPGDASPTQVVPAAPAPVRVYAGSTAFTDSQGSVWTPDVNSQQMTVAGGGLNRPVRGAPIAGALPTSSDQALYQSERFGTFSYTFSSLPAGFYQVTLKLAEITWSDANHRVFNVSVNGVQQLTNVDLIAMTGKIDTATDVVLQDIVPSNGQILIEFAPAAGSADQDAKISAVEVASQLFAYPQNLDAVGTFFGQLAEVAFQAQSTAANSQMQLRFTDNTVDNASSIALLVCDGRAETPQTLRTQSTLSASGNVLRRTSVTQGTFQWLSSVACLAGVDWVTVTGNQLLNLGDGSIFSLLMASESTQGVAQGSTTAIAVTGNLLRGALLLPARPTPVPATDTWDFFNTQMP